MWCGLVVRRTWPNCSTFGTEIAQSCDQGLFWMIVLSIDNLCTMHHPWTHSSSPLSTHGSTFYQPTDFKCPIAFELPGGYIISKYSNFSSSFLCV